MKRSQIWQGLAGITLLMVAIISGCTRSLTTAPVAAIPTATNTAIPIGNTSTATRTSTRTNTATPTNTVAGNTATSTATTTATSSPTVTATQTNSNTNVPGATDTFTSTTTLTPTVTLTSTATASATTTNTNVPGATSTSTATATIAQCKETSLVTAYPFDTTLGCWYVDSSSTSAISSLNISTTTMHNGAGAMHAVVAEPATSANLQIETDYATAQNLTGLTLTAWVYVDSTLAGSGTGVQFFCQSTSGYNWTNGGGAALSGKGGQWVYVTWTIAATDITQVERIGLQFYGVPASAPGNVYIDDVKLVAGLCNASSVVTNFGFEGSLNCWKVDADSVAVVPDWGVTIGGPAHGGTGAMYATIVEPATSSAVKLDLNYAPTQNLSGMTLNAWVWVDPAFADSTIQLFFQSGNAGSWTWVNSTGTAIDAAHCGSWQQVSFNPSTASGWGVPQSSDVGLLGIQLSGMPANTSGKFYIDDVTLVAAATSTPTNSPTETETATITDTPADTNTPLPGTTDTYTATLTVTPTVTTTPTTTSTNTLVPFPTVCNGVFQTAYTFDTSEECWRFDSTSTTAVAAFEISSSQVTQGTGALHIGFAEPATSVPVQIEQNFATEADLSGRTMSAWIYVDPSMLYGGINFFTQTAGWSSFKNGGDVYLDATKVGKWIQVSWLLVGGDLTKTDQVGMQFYNIQASAIGNIYVDNITFSSPATPTNTPNPACTPYLLNGCEIMSENGTWGGSNSSLAIEPMHYTQGSNALDIDITNPVSWNNGFLQLSGFTPNVWSNVTQLTMDMYVDASVLSGTTYNKLYLDASTGGGTWQRISASNPMLSVGANSVTFNIDFTQGTVLPTNPLDMFVVTFQSDNSITNTGNIYLDNVQLVQTCP